MLKRVVIAGCRDYNNYDEAKRYIDFCISNIKKRYKLIFISGGCRGTDLLGEKYAAENGFEIERYPAEWDKYGKMAGPRRNERMAKCADYVICFWDGQSKGTWSMIQYAREYEKPLKIKYIKP